MTTDAESLLRDKLKVALQHAKKLFDDGLIDEKEFKDLKAHELSKYKEQLSALTASSILRRTVDTTPSSRNQQKADVTPVHTPRTNRQMRDGSRPSPESVPSTISPPTRIRRQGPSELMYVDSNTFSRLTTPPIFRRRSAKKRRIVVHSAELKALQELTPETLLDVSMAPTPEN